MTVRDRLTPLIAALGRVKPSQVTADARLGDLGVGSSIAIGMLQAKLRDTFGTAPAPLSWKSTVGDIERGLESAKAPVREHKIKPRPKKKKD